MPLWFLPAGEACDQPSDLLRSARFVKAFGQLANQFEWTVVDSAPMLPTVDVNLWSRLLDGTLLVVREGTTPVNVLKKGLKALDHPKLIGIVVNDATGFDQVNYKSPYYPSPDRREKSAKSKMNAP
jgi:Mrp family chromosome partitioning ATPase